MALGRPPVRTLHGPRLNDPGPENLHREARTTRGTPPADGVRCATASPPWLAWLLLSACLTAPQQSALDALDKDRKANRVTALGTQNDAQAKAQAWADKLARQNRLHHSKLSDGIEVRWCNLGENVGYGSSVGVAENGNRTFVVQVFIRTC